ncbi:MAG: amino acid adenylation domain-containing protein [Bacteroidota bacterium]
MIYLLPHTITHAATRFPDREAFRCGDKSLTFKEIAVKMNQLAALLHHLNIQKGDRIGIYLNRSIEAAIAIHGIMHAGAVYVPLDPKAPIRRTQYLIKDCGIKILITNHSQRRNVKNIVADGTALDAIIGISQAENIPTFAWEKLEEFPSDFRPPFPILENDLAYIMYTSGSTGQPKGIMHTHASGLAYARLTADLYQLNEQDRIGTHAPIYFDISTLGFFTAPLVGACSVIVTDAHTVLPASLSQLIDREKLTVWYSVPLAMIQMLQAGTLTPQGASALRWVLYGGEAFPPKYLRELMALWSNATFSNVYGPAEVNQCTYFNFTNLPTGTTSIPLGQVWKNTEGIVLDENDEEVKQGEGVLCIRSATMMKGYWQQPELTERSFYRRKNNTHTYDTFYRTGDLVKIDEWGVLHFLGRIDHQVKIRGYRVELSAVEVALVAHAAVSEAAVFPIRKKETALHIEAAVILQPSVTTSTSELLIHLKEKLPTYAVPEKITIVDTFPRTGSGKVKRSKLIELLYS